MRCISTEKENEHKHLTTLYLGKIPVAASQRMPLS